MSSLANKGFLACERGEKKTVEKGGRKREARRSRMRDEEVSKKKQDLMKLFTW